MTDRRPRRQKGAFKFSLCTYQAKVVALRWYVGRPGAQHGGDDVDEQPGQCKICKVKEVIGRKMISDQRVGSCFVISYTICGDFDCSSVLPFVLASLKIPKPPAAHRGQPSKNRSCVCYTFRRAARRQIIIDQFRRKPVDKGDYTFNLV